MSRNETEERFGRVQSDLTIIDWKYADRVKELKQRISTLEEDNDLLKKKVAALETAIAQLIK
jgi:hypothetical protein